MVYLSEKILIHHKKRKTVVEAMNGKPFVQHHGKEQRKFQFPKCLKAPLTVRVLTGGWRTSQNKGKLRRFHVSAGNGISSSS